MTLKLPRTNIEQQLRKIRNRNITEALILKEVEDIFKTQQITDDQILNTIQCGDAETSNLFNIDLLETSRIFHVKDIENICITYRLRFLDSTYFKGEIPYEALTEIKKLEKIHLIKLKGYKILAPSKLFKLKNADDPLLFVPIGNDYYHLIHKWGNDLHPLRKLLMWPFKCLENFMLLLLSLSFLAALIVPEGLFTAQQTNAQFFMIFFFIFKGFAGLSIFYGFKYGKNFNTEIWNSKYFNA